MASVKKPKKRTGQKKAVQDRQDKQPNFHGRDCALFLYNKGDEPNYLKLLKNVKPTMTDDDYACAIDLWATLVDLVDLLLETFDTPADIFKTDDGTMQARREHAEAISQAASEYIEAIKEIDGSGAILLYPHIAKEHAPAMVLAVGSLPRWSMQPEEHLHALRKKDKSRRSAHASGGEKRRGGGVVERSFLSTQFGVEWNRIVANAQQPEREPIWVRAKKRRQDLLAAAALASD